VIEILLAGAKERIPTMTDSELAEACREVMRLQNFEMLEVVNPDDVAELFALIGFEVNERKLISDKSWMLHRTDRRR
jgi:hypothetical protein